MNGSAGGGGGGGGGTGTGHSSRSRPAARTVNTAAASTMRSASSDRVGLYGLVYNECSVRGDCTCSSLRLLIRLLH